MNQSVSLHRFDVETPLGIVHLAGFLMAPADQGRPGKNHRAVIFQILSEVAGFPVTADDLQESKENTRPTFPKLNFDVNWTHSGGYCVVAYGEPGVRVGVDLERHSPKHLRLADRFYSEDEAVLLRGIDADHRMVEFYRLWSRKEALYKCVGGKFFEDAVGRSVLESPLRAGSDLCPHDVHFVDLNGDIVKKAAGFPAALCVAVTKAR